MRVKAFRDTLDKLTATNSRNEKKAIIREVSDSTAAISFLSGSEFDDAGLGKRTVLSCAQEVYGHESVSGSPTVSEDLKQFDTQDTPRELSELYDDMETLADLSGNAQKKKLREIFAFYDYPSVVSHACLDDLATGVSDTTIANALDLRDSLPFYESVVDVAAAENPRTSPAIGEPFDPMLAVPESRGRPDTDDLAAQRKLDGYRCLIHVDDGSAQAFSRRQNEITESLPELQEIDWPDGQYILDAEVLAETGSYSDTSERIGRTADNIERDVEMQFGVFDIVLCQNDASTSHPIYADRYYDRMAVLWEMDDAITDWRFHVLDLKTDIQQAKDLAAANGEEGIIVKDMTAPYEFGSRSASWQKVKMDDETVDVRITGFVEGEGRLAETLGKVQIESADGVSLGNSGSGFTDAQRAEIWENKGEWLGEPIEVEARGLGTNDNLRMPIYKRDRRDDGEADSFEKIEAVMKEI